MCSFSTLLLLLFKRLCGIAASAANKGCVLYLGTVITSEFISHGIEDLKAGWMLLI